MARGLTEFKELQARMKSGCCVDRWPTVSMLKKHASELKVTMMRRDGYQRVSNNLVTRA